MHIYEKPNFHSPFILMLLGKIFILAYQRRKILCSLENERNPRRWMGYGLLVREVRLWV